MAAASYAISVEGRVRNMANRHTLHISKLDSFREWLVKDGWEIEDPKGIYEVLRARKAGRQNPLIVYRKADAKEYLSFMDRDSGVVGAFLRDFKNPKTNADRIRAMNDEELAEFIEQISADSMDTISFGTKDYEEIWEHKETALKWLQSEVEE